jgi:hypothetical protein
VWDEFRKETEDEFKGATQRYPTAVREYEKKKAEWEESGKQGGEPKPPRRPHQRMQRGEDENFLRFAAFLKTVVGNSIRTDTVPTIKNLLRDYLLNFSKVSLRYTANSTILKDFNFPVLWK